MAEMPTTTGAGHFNPPHAVAHVLVFYDAFGASRQHEARPAAAGVELGAAQEEQRAARSAVVVSGLVVLREPASERAFRTLLAQNLVLLLGKHLAPLSVAAHDFLG